jgi:hypothetical protein
MQKEKIIETYEKIKNLYPNFYEKASLNSGSKKFYFLFLSTILTLNFYLAFYLTDKNPYSLLIPFTFFDVDLPLADKRVQVKLYLSDGAGNVFLSERKVLLDFSDIRSSLMTLAIEISRPPYYEIEENLNKKDLNINLKKLPNIHYSIKTIWIVNKDTLIIDFRESSLLSEFANMKVRIENKTYEIKEENESDSKLEDLGESEVKNKDEIQKLKMALLKSTFLALEKTIFDNYNEIKSIEYKLDGVSKNFLNLEYELSVPKKRGE